jgi:hypothetical protein
LTTESHALTHSLFADDLDVSMVESSMDSCSTVATNFTVNQHLLLLQQSNWFNPPLSSLNTPSLKLPIITGANLTEWKSSIKVQENISAQTRRNRMDSSNQSQDSSSSIHETESANPTQSGLKPEVNNTTCPQTKTPHIDKFQSTENMDPEKIINDIGSRFNLNKKQWIGFRIIARAFLQIHLQLLEKKEPLRILLTGPGGTGKTHVVQALHAVMAVYGCEHVLRFLAPTGSAATLINGMTIHKGLGIKIKSNQKGKGNRKPGEGAEDYTVLISVHNRTALRDGWRLVEVLWIDEISLLSQQLISEVNHALRYATERPDEWFEGITVIFSGDFFQYPPIGGTPLYAPIPHTSSKYKSDVARRLGRLAWKSINAVVSLTEQERMKDDQEYASAVNRLRIHQCTVEDVDLFNSCVIKSANNEEGIDTSIPDNASSTAIVGTNLLREAINAHKTWANCSTPHSPELITCAAYDKITCGPSSEEIMKHLLNLNISKLSTEGALPGFVPLYVGMPVILRYRNISTELGISWITRSC